MKQLSIFVNYLILLWLTSFLAFAESISTYAIFKGVSEPHYQANKNFFNRMTISNEWQLFKTQCKSIVGKLDQTLLGTLAKETKNAIFSIPQSAEVGIGCRYAFIIPIAGEFTGIAMRLKEKTINTKPNPIYLYFSGAIKAFLPLSSKSTFYIKLGKMFQANPNTPMNELFPMQTQVWTKVLKDSQQSFWEQTPKNQWKNSYTVLGAGITYKLSSQLEVDASVHGITNKNLYSIWYSVSYGLHYCI